MKFCFFLNTLISRNRTLQNVNGFCEYKSYVILDYECIKYFIISIFFTMSWTSNKAMTMSSFKICTDVS